MVKSMKQSTKILAALPFVLLLLSSVSAYKDSASDINLIFMAYLSIGVFNIYLLTQNKASDYLYSVVLGLMFVEKIGSVLKIMHWPFAGTMLILGMMGSALAAILFIRVFINERKSNPHLILGVLILLQIIFTIGIVMPSLKYSILIDYATYLKYPILAICAGIVLNKKYVCTGEKNVLLLILLEGVFFIVKHILFAYLI
jgi:hypothetical protein